MEQPAASPWRFPAELQSIAFSSQNIPALAYSDAISRIERHDQLNRALVICMGPNSHLERLITARPHLIGKFMLRRI